MRYIPHTQADRAEMLETIGVSSIEDLFHEIPPNLRVAGDLPIPESLDENSLVRRLSAIGSANKSLDKTVSFLGAGIYEHYIPALVPEVISRGEFMTAYTPYQPEASQGYLQTIYEFQTMICAITGMDVCNASMYDGATALAEAALMCSGVNGRTQVLISTAVHPHYRQVLHTFAEPAGCVVKEFDGNTEPSANTDTACIIAQYPDFFGRIAPLRPLVEAARSSGALLVVASEPVALGVLRPPGEIGADVVVGEAQPLGVPMGYGGPLVGYFCVNRELIRAIPGRIVGRTFDKHGRRGFVMTLRTREQDIRREKATSNICTNQALMALAATVWMSALGKQGFRELAETCVQKAHYLAREVCRIPGLSLAYPDDPFCFEFALNVGRSANEVRDRMLEHGILAGLPLGDYYPDMANCLLIAVTEVRTRSELDAFVTALARVVN